MAPNEPNQGTTEDQKPKDDKPKDDPKKKDDETKKKDAPEKKCRTFDDGLNVFPVIDCPECGNAITLKYNEVLANGDVQGRVTCMAKTWDKPPSKDPKVKINRKRIACGWTTTSLNVGVFNPKETPDATIMDRAVEREEERLKGDKKAQKENEKHVAKREKVTLSQKQKEARERVAKSQKHQDAANKDRDVRDKASRGRSVRSEALARIAAAEKKR